MPRQLKNLVISEVSSVDRGAGEGVKILLMKREPNDRDDVVIDFDVLRSLKKIAPEIAAGIDAAVAKLREEMADPTKAEAAIQKFNDQIAGLIPGNTETTMTKEEIEALVTKAITTATAPLTATITKLEGDLAFEKLSPEAREFCKAMSDEDKKKFMGKDKAKQDEEMADAKKRAAGDPVVKLLTGEVEDLKKRLAVSDERDAIATFGKRAKDLGLPEAHGEVMRKAYGGDAEAIKKHEDMLKGLAEQVRTGKVFAEFGNSQGGGTQTSYDQFVAKAAELRKTQPTLTPEQAFDKVYNDPANVALREGHKAEEMAKRQAVAA